jgi:hypothetical protein
MAPRECGTCSKAALWLVDQLAASRACRTYALFRRCSAHVVVLQLSRLLRSFVGLGGQDERRSLSGPKRRAPNETP